jgi:hypothetical protein
MFCALTQGLRRDAAEARSAGELTLDLDELAA